MLTEKMKLIIRTIAECDMNRNEAGRVLYMHRNTIDYQCERIKDITGLSPKNFYDLIILLRMIQGDENDNT